MNYSLKSVLETAKGGIKYFYECGNDQKQDARFASKDCPNVSETEPHAPLVHNLKEAQSSLVSILSAWSTFSTNNKITWWISHGEMLGWYWNAQLLPWDVDLDIQMSTYQLMQLIQWNQTMIADRFLIDIAPSVFVRVPQTQNIIDARVVDTQTGYFMDITGLTRVKEDENVFWCKSPHSYLYDQLMPLHETILSGVKVWRPRAVMTILKEEYSEIALYSTSFKPDVKGSDLYLWNETAKAWVKDARARVNLLANMLK
ncbi:UNVERIFIED_CONTAM: hypothetical protein HDU68_010843 [Siphonaria sp. JEL0065]|nr:hypothetical protein HDU68_010843 [Siphonaria sp. JEL0065]